MEQNKLPSIYGRYILLNKIAVGGMAEVFRAKSFGAENFEKLLAIKRLYPHLSEDHSFVQMFINEARLAATLNHVNIVPIYDFGSQQGFYYIAMEYVRGCDLADLIVRCRNRQQQLPLGLAIWLLIEICDGLDYAHRKHDDVGHFLNLIHRDITPQNILLSYEGEVKITDFGIAKVQMLERDETTGGMLKGKFSYMSPEQVRGDRLDHRSDIFSLGIVAWELLTGQKMFDGPNDYHILEKVREALFIPPRQLNPHLPSEVEQIITKALTRYPNDRYQSVGQMRLDLLRFLSHSRLFPSRAHLSAFVRKLFADQFEKETFEIMEETRLSRTLWQNYQHSLQLSGTSTISGSLLPFAQDNTLAVSSPNNADDDHSVTLSHLPKNILASISDPLNLSPSPMGEEDDPTLPDMGLSPIKPNKGFSQKLPPQHVTLPPAIPNPPTDGLIPPPLPRQVAALSPKPSDPIFSGPAQIALNGLDSVEALSTDDEASFRRSRYRKNLQLFIGISTFFLGVILVLILARWLFPN